MSKEQKNSLVPELRFPEFKNDGNWQEKTLEALSSNISSGKDKIDLDGIYPLYGSTGIIGKTTNYSYEGDFILVARVGANAGFLTRSRGKFGVTDNTLVVSLYDSENTNFIFYTLEKFGLNRLIFGSGQPLITGGQLKAFVLYCSKPKEQQKIADCLSSLDDLITAESGKLEALKAHKKGLMQQLFPAEGETVPKLRFAEFRDSGEWKEKTLGELGDVQMCKRIFAEETNANGGVPFFKIGTLGGKPDAFISRELFEEYRSKYNFPEKGEVLITCSGTVGKTIVYDGSAAYYQDSNIVWIDNPKLEITNKLLYYILSDINWNILNSTTITRIYGSDLRNLKIIYPLNHTEQNKVAECLSCVDQLIMAQTDLVEELQLHKKGLMQGLFPKLND